MPETRRSRIPRRLLAAALAAACCAAFPLAIAPRAEASEFMVSVMQDDNNLLYASPEVRDYSLDTMKLLGVDAVRITVLWEALAPPRRINGANPAAYGAKRWDRYDGVVRAALSRGILPYFSVTAPGPSWVHAKAEDPANRRTWKPKAREWGRLMQALGRRYSGRYRDENEGRQLLPRVAWWGIFNEPNQGGWLTPQSEQVKGVRGWVPTSPAMYRELLVEGAKALIRTGHADDIVLLGETAPLGDKPSGERRPLRPALFLRELFCLDKRLRPMRGRSGKARGCERVKRLSVLSRLSRLSYGHHPYTKTLPPTKRDRNRESISMANIKTLPGLLDKIAARTRLIPKSMPIFLTEFGYETKPPDPFNGITLDKQSEYLNVGDYIAYRNPRIFATTQFLLADVPPQRQYPRNSRQYWFTYQSGLFTDQAEPKPAAFAWSMPFEARRSGGGQYLLWGQVRFTPNGAPQTVYLQVRSGSGWVTVGDAIKVDNYMGFWEVKRAAQAGQTWRAVWTTEDFSEFRTGREITLK